MKKDIAKLEELKEVADQFGEDGVEENLMEDDEDDKNRIKYKPRKTKMCKDILEKGKCKLGRECKFAHNAIELNLVKIDKKINNLKGVVATQSRMLNQNQTVGAFIPPSKHVPHDISCFQPYIETKADVGENEDGEEKPKSIFERDDLFKDPLEEKD